MKIAIASEGKHVSNHFGHCEGFTVYDARDNKIIKKEFVPNPGHRPGFLPRFLKDLGVNTVISGGMGETAQQLFAQNDIDVIVGTEGYCDDIVEQYLKGELKTTGSVCREHQYEEYCRK